MILDMKKIIIVFFVHLLAIPLFAQTADEAYSRPLSDILQSIEKQFHIQFKYDKKMIDGKQLPYADWRIRPWSLDKTLQAVLSPFDYKYVMDNGKYKIKSYEYARTTDEEGKEFLDYLKTLYSDKESWEKRKTALKTCMREALHLPTLIPAKPASKVILTPKRKYNGYTVENFAIETLPGVYVCGSIYQPAKINRKCPVMLNPNGHFGQGRYREDQQKRCAMEARMGIIAADWDLFAWGESLLQFDGTLHRLSAAQSIQTLNTIRVLDYLLTLKTVDSNRVGITGGSGGGSMTMMVSAIDDRITLSIPVVMLSSHFSGGCPCESGMPTHLCGNRTNNAEVAAMFAPKPLLAITDGGDWSNTVPTLEYPFLQRTYGFYGAADKVKNVHLPDEGHDYGFSKRKSLYEFVAQIFGLNSSVLKDAAGNFDEGKVTLEKEEQMYVFGAKGERLPANALKGKEALLTMLKKIGY
jgi:hypothetical protein